MSSPTAVLFQALPPLAPDEYRALEESIESHGIQVPVLVDENGVVIDGHHRQKIASHLGLECPTVVKSGYTDAEKRTLALSLNIDRRQLSREQKRALIAESIKADPQLSDREHAKRTGASPSTAGAVREKLVSEGLVSKLDTRVGSDGVQQPASKPRPAIDPEDPDLDDDTQSDSGHAPRNFPGLTAEQLAELNVQPTPEREIRQPNRRPLPDAFGSATYELTKLAERITRLSNDDRFEKNSGQLAQKNLAELTRARDALQGVINRLPQPQP